MAPCIVPKLQIPAGSFVHPGLLNTAWSLENRVAARANAANVTAMKLGWQALSAHDAASLGHVPNPCRVVYTGTGESPDPPSTAYACADGLAITQDQTERFWKDDARAAYAHTLSWVVLRNQDAIAANAHAKLAAAILNGWADTLIAVDLTSWQAGRLPGEPDASSLTSAWLLPMYAESAEILRHYKGGYQPSNPADALNVQAVEKMFRYIAYKANEALYRDDNQGASATLALMTAGVFTNNRRMYDEGRAAWQFLLPRVINHPQGEPEEFFARDCQHPQYSFIAFSYGAEIDFNQTGQSTLYDTKTSGAKPLLQQSGEFFGWMFRPNFQNSDYPNYPFATYNSMSDRCLPGAGIPGFEVPYNHYRWRKGYSPSMDSPNPLYGGMIDFENWTTGTAPPSLPGLDPGRPDGMASLFIGWTSLTHGDLTKP